MLCQTLPAPADIGTVCRVEDALQAVAEQLQANYGLVDGTGRRKGVVAREADVRPGQEVVQDLPLVLSTESRVSLAKMSAGLVREDGKVARPTDGNAV